MATLSAELEERRLRVVGRAPHRLGDHAHIIAARIGPLPTADPTNLVEEVQ